MTNTIPQKASEMDYASRFSTRAQALQSSAIREILKVTERPEVISFAGGLPSPATFPVEAINAALQKVLSEKGQVALQYSTTEGYAPLREWIAAQVGTAQAPVSADDVLIVSGSQQGLDLLAKALINEGDKVLVEAPTYLGALQSLSLFSPHYVPIAADEEGLQPEALTDDMRGAKLLYVLPNFQNPTGRLLSQSRRHALVQRARELDFLILEDDPYGALSYDGHVPPSIRSLAPERTVYMGSFSKVLAPGLRLGYVIAPPALRSKLVQIKQATDLHTATLTQMAVYEVLKTGILTHHLPEIRTLYAAQCTAMLEALKRYMPEQVRWNSPRGGMFLWVQLPAGLNATDLLNKAIEQNVAFVPGAPFYAADPVQETLRLAFVTVPPSLIDEGVKRLAEIIKKVLVK